jgi:YVTN family beta-propeller protein
MTGLLVCLALAAAGRAQEVIDSIDVGGAIVGSLAYNQTARVVYGASEESYYFFAISCDSHKVVSRIYRRMPMYIAYAPRVNKAYFTQRTQDIDSVIVVDGTTHQYLRGIPLLWATVPLYDSASNRLYVSCDEENEVGVIDCATDSVIARIHVGQGPVWMDLNSQGRRLYVRNWDGESVSIIDLQTLQVIRTIPVGNVPEAGCYDAAMNKDYCAIGSAVVVIDGAGDTLLTHIDLPLGCSVKSFVAAGALAMAGVTLNNDAWLYVVDCATDTVLNALRVGREPHGLVYSPASGLVYSASSLDDNLYVIAADGSRILTTVSVTGYPFALQPVGDRNHLYVGHLDSRKVYVVKDSVTGVAEPVGAAISQPPLIVVGPNPFAGATTIRCGVRLALDAGICIFSQDGRQVRRLVPDLTPPGSPMTFAWNGKDELGKRVPKGVYLAVVAGQAGVRAKLVKLD